MVEQVANCAMLVLAAASVLPKNHHIWGLHRTHRTSQIRAPLPDPLLYFGYFGYFCLQEVARKGAMPAGLLAASSNAAGAGYDSDAEARDWADLYEDYLDAELEEDEEIESYYFSSAAGRARVVLGNRRWGEGGFMRAGGQKMVVL
jgi:hypothetical protein